eukprot:GEZU01017652.1.p1 GENE.GEZU01017652.1~~GEZU01017652.1.p1  ORF type:complete len:212 (-),score=76.04 GEZU01017652.1:242-856(-)
MAASAEGDESYQIVVCGGGAVGKSCITIQYTQHIFVDSYDPTIEDSYLKQTKVDGKVVRLSILDTAGQDEYESLRDTYMRTGDGFLVVFDLSSPKSFKEMQEFHDRILRVKDLDFVPMVIVGNKCDLPDANKLIKEAEVRGVIKQWATKTAGYEVPYLEASALKRFMIEESFDALVREIRKYRGATTGSGDQKDSKKKKDCLIQ